MSKVAQGNTQDDISLQGLWTCWK